MINKIILFTAITVLISCRKSNYQSPVTPVVPDSLYNWKTIATIKNIFSEDICFTSDTRGFIAADLIYQTSDGGNSWAAIPGISASPGFANLFFINSLTGWAQGLSSLASTTNGGNTWTIQSLPTSSATTIFFSSPSHGFYGDESAGLQMTTDAGKSWGTVYIDQPLQTDYYPYFINPDTGYVATGWGKFAATINAGASWQPTNTMLPVNGSSGIYNQLYFLNVDTGFYACYSGVLKTTDGGINWVNVLAENAQGVNVIKFPDSRTGFYKGNQEIYMSIDGGDDWTLSCKLGSSYFMGISFPDIHHGWACTSDGRVLYLNE